MYPRSRLSVDVFRPIASEDFSHSPTYSHSRMRLSLRSMCSPDRESSSWTGIILYINGLYV